MPLISIIVPIYNVEKYLRQCLDSVINQTYKNLEIILINDCSKDNSLEIIKEYAKKDNRIVVIDLSENHGYGKVINLGLVKAKGEWVGIVESDDFIADNMYERLALATQKTDAEIIKSGFYLFYDKRKLKKNVAIPVGILDKCKEGSEVKVEGLNLELFLLKPTIWSSIYKKKFLEEKGIKALETNGASYQDFPFFCETLFTTNKVYIINESFYYYRQTNVNSSVKSRDRAKIIFSITDYITNTLKKRDLERFNQIRLIIYMMFCYHYLYHFFRIRNRYRLEFLNDLKESLNKMIADGFVICRIKEGYLRNLLKYCVNHNVKAIKRYLILDYIYHLNKKK